MELFLRVGTPSKVISTSDMVKNFHQHTNGLVTQFCQRVQAVTWEKSLIRTKSGNIGLASKLVQVGDLVAILHGRSVPVILRWGREKTLAGNKARKCGRL